MLHKKNQLTILLGDQANKQYRCKDLPKLMAFYYISKTHIDKNTSSTTPPSNSLSILWFINNSTRQIGWNKFQ